MGRGGHGGTYISIKIFPIAYPHQDILDKIITLSEKMKELFLLYELILY